MSNTLDRVRSRIDELLPNHDFSARYEIRINAPASAVYQFFCARTSANCGWCAS